MCGRFTLTAAEAAVDEQFGIASALGFSPRYNIAPTQDVVAVRISKAGEREAAQLRWGLIPSWAKDATIGNKLINARAETVAEKPSFRAAYKKRRCLVAADGYYEWQKTDDGKQPFRIGMKDWSVFGLAGLWEHWIDGDGKPIETCTLITTTPNALMEPIHHRMPVIVAPDDYERWIDPNTSEVADLLQPFDASEMSAVAVSTWVNNARNADPRCIEPLDQT